MEKSSAKKKKRKNIVKKPKNATLKIIVTVEVI